MAQAALDDGVADLVEMTRAQIADPRLVALVRAGPARPGPALHPVQPGLPGPGQPQPDRQLRGRAPQRARDRRARRSREPIRSAGEVLVVGAGRGRARVRPGAGRRGATGHGWWSGPTGPAGRCVTAAVGPGRQRLAGLAEWLMAECRAQGVDDRDRGRGSTADLDAARPRGVEVVLATGSRPAAGGRPRGRVVPGDRRRSSCWPGTGAAARRAGGGPRPGRRSGRCRGGRVAGRRRAQVSLVTPDQMAGTLLSITGDLADANTRLQRAGVRPRAAGRAPGGRRRAGPSRGRVDRASGGPSPAPRSSTAATGCPRSPSTWSRPGTLRAGDCVAPRSVLEAVLEGRRLALDIAGWRRPRRGSRPPPGWHRDRDASPTGRRRDGCRARWP